MGCGSLKMLQLLQADTESAPGFRAPKVRCGLCCLKEFCAPDEFTRGDIYFLKTFVKKQ